jgi:hypothetical protein
MGLYPPGESGAYNMTDAEMSSIHGVAKPPFTVRDAPAINEKLGASALPHGFSAAPEVTFGNPSVRDDCSWDGCATAEESIDSRGYDPETYANYTYLEKNVADPTADALNLTAGEMIEGDFTQYYHWEDVIRCLKFENGTTYMNWTFTNETWLNALEF